MNNDTAIQEYYEDKVSHCYGCGRLNEHGLHIRSYWQGDQAICVYEPRDYHIAIPGYVYGGLIASIIDCHSIGAAAAAAYQQEDRLLGSEPRLRYVTASLHVDYLRPTPLGGQLVATARVKEMGGRKIVMSCEIEAEGVLCARGEVVAVPLPEKWLF